MLPPEHQHEKYRHADKIQFFFAVGLQVNLEFPRSINYFNFIVNMNTHIAYKQLQHGHRCQYLIQDC